MQFRSAITSMQISMQLSFKYTSLGHSIFFSDSELECAWCMLEDKSTRDRKDVIREDPVCWLQDCRRCRLV